MKFTREDDKLKAARLLKEVHAKIEKIKSWQRVFAFVPVSVSSTESVWLEYYWRRKRGLHTDDYDVRFRMGDLLRPYICEPITILIESCSDEEYQAKHAPK